MDCSLIQTDLIAYHFATIADDERARVEEHLLGCTGCLRTYLALKATMDRGGSEEQPSDQARLALRAAVEKRFRPTLPRRVGRWLTRPVPFYQGVAIAAALAIVAALAPVLGDALRPTHTAERVDTARPTAESVTIY